VATGESVKAVGGLRREAKQQNPAGAEKTFFHAAMSVSEE